jgi:hypothetical protein
MVFPHFDGPDGLPGKARFRAAFLRRFTIAAVSVINAS